MIRDEHNAPCCADFTDIATQIKGALVEYGLARESSTVSMLWTLLDVAFDGGALCEAELVTTEQQHAL